MPVMSSVRKVVRLGVVFFVAVKFIKFLRYLAELRRAHALAKKLPTVPASIKDRGVLGCAAGSDFVGDEELSLDSLRNNLIGGIRRLLQHDESVREVGLLQFWFLNRHLSRFFPFHNLYTVVVFGKSKLKQILAKKNQYLYSKGTSYDVAGSLIGKSVLSTSGDEWHNQRLILDHGFKDEMLQSNFDSISVTVQELVDKWKPLAGTEINVLEESLKMTMDVLGRYAFSYNFGSVVASTTDDAPLYNSFNSILRILNSRVFVPPLEYLKKVPFLNINRVYDKSLDKLEKQVEMIVAERRRERDSGIVKSQDLLDVMLSNVDGRSLENSQIVDNIKTMLFAGHDTTAAAITWMTQLLATHKEVLDILREELNQVLPCNKDPGFEDLEKCEYLNAIVIESLRLYPSAGFTRNALEDIELEGYVIPKGTEIFLLPYVTHRDPLEFPDPNSFKPERWIDHPMLQEKNLSLAAKMTILTHSLPFLPFSAGVRNCVGRKLALTEIRVTIIKLFQNFDFEPVHKTTFKSDPALWMTLVPQGVFLKPTLLA